jgi:flagellar hook-associated protein 1 FlgK
MSSSILSVGQSALAAAQVGLVTTGHNIANASTPGYSRQIVVQGAVAGQDNGFGFVGKGTEVTAVRRVYSEFLSTQVNAALTSKGRLDSYYAQAKRIDSMLADPSVGVSPAVQGFFKDVQNLSADPNSAAARQSLLSSANSLAASFQTLDTQLAEMNNGINSEIHASVTSINAYARQIAQLNESIEKAQANSGGKPANDLLDQRDLIVTKLAGEIKVNVVEQNGTYNVFIGNGQPLVINTKTFNLVPLTSTTDSSRLDVGYVAKGETTRLSETALAGGRLSGLFEFRSGTLDATQNALGAVALALATTFNAQHALGQTQTGAMGGDFFKIAGPTATASTANTGDGVPAAAIVDSSALVVSDYRLQFDGNNYNLTRMSDAEVTQFAAFPQTIDGIRFDMTGTPQTSDSYLIRPTAAVAGSFKLKLSDTAAIAAAAPVVTAANANNTGAAAISAGSASAGFASASVTPAIALMFSASGSGMTLGGFPNEPVTVTNDGVDTVFAAGAPVPYTPGATLSFSGISFSIAGQPSAGDSFTIGRNAKGAGDSRNALLLGSLQSQNTLNGKTTTYLGAYAQMVSLVGNKTREMEVTSSAANKLHAQAVQAKESESGVNLDEEAANLMRYQQAYQAAGKVMQTAGDLFQTLLELGR